MADVTRLDGGRVPAPATRLDGATPIAQPSNYIRENLPTTLAQRYSIVRELGRGGEATVWLCTDTVGNQVAIKMFQHPPTYRTDFGSAAYRDRFRAEHTVQVFARGQDDGVSYEVMEFCALGTLEDHMNRHSGKITHGDAVDILRELAGALHGMQGPDTGMKLVHGDINPKNILVRTDRPLDLVLTDFGLSVDLAGRSRLSNTGKGTLAYSAPGAMRYYTQADDWWSVGMTMYQIIVGRNYFQRSDGHWISDDRIENELTVRDIALGEINELPFTEHEKKRWQLLLAGLLTRDREFRWSMREVGEWCGGGAPKVHRLIDVSKVPDSEFGTGTTQENQHSIPPFALAGVGEFRDPRELGEAMAADPKAAARAVSGRRAQVLLAWLKDEVKTRASYAELRTYSDLWGPDEIAVYFVSQLAPAATLTYRDHPISTPGDLRKLAQSASTVTVVSRLFETHILAGIDGSSAERGRYRMIDANWHDMVEQADDQARSARVSISSDERAGLTANALLIAASDDAVARKYIASVAKRVEQSVAARETSGWFASIRRGFGQ
ncbi:serine/threonine protein kinase [Rhodococcus sp. AD45-ID]|uniref:serine/threonine-protein kinase n=1 Tax=Rhodococcus TaxID=1827 RepID=UPI0005D38C8B|nr:MULTISPECIES: serine/threonine-protein kinase [Rhodococcus]KJF24926.1 Serine/threonine-protein kinase PrkC [Rhodococcus sp. AD45]PSR43154.1 serine/threonine protein kinase [Rhodococcus sp. AD45-ID]QXW00617.1 serine/threonine protein kinase [Rhodococcus globerulus]